MGIVTGDVQQEEGLEVGKYRGDLYRLKCEPKLYGPDGADALKEKGPPVGGLPFARKAAAVLCVRAVAGVVMSEIVTLTQKQNVGCILHPGIHPIHPSGLARAF